MTIMSAAVTTLNTLNYSMGVVAFSSVLFMLHMDAYTVDSHPRSWVRWMVYLDALAFFVLYQADLVRDVSTCSMHTSIYMAADIVWSFKDFFKFGYLVYRGLAIVGSKRVYPIYWTAAGSLVLYWIYIACAYGHALGSTDCTLDGFNDNSLIALYLYWTLVEVVVSAMVVRKMSKVQRKVRMANFAVETYDRFKFKEEVRLLIACIGMGMVTSVTIVDSLAGFDRRDLALTRFVFVYMQLLLLLGSASGDLRESGGESEGEDEDDADWKRRSIDS
ncbi:hypothetical protein HDU80_009987 [Chytriomyces hyalinus]|nr:hypothetical protein HDU80_009987 [Chytriomyces hyalinus]